jgi:hypothetical protein
MQAPSRGSTCSKNEADGLHMNIYETQNTSVTPLRPVPNNRKFVLARIPSLKVKLFFIL